MKTIPASVQLLTRSVIMIHIKERKHFETLAQVYKVPFIYKDVLKRKGGGKDLIHFFVKDGLLYKYQETITKGDPKPKHSDVIKGERERHKTKLEKKIKEDVKE